MLTRSRMKGDKKKFGLLASDIEKYTRVGSFELQRGNLEKACEAFEFAYRRSLQLEEGYTERACAHNLGAIFVALGQPVKGLEYLQKAVPPMNKRDNHSNGDLYYNFGIGYEGLSIFHEAAMYYEKAAEEYRSGELVKSDSRVLVDIYTRLSTLYSQGKNHAKAAKSFEDLSKECQRLNMPSMRVQALSQQSNQLWLVGDSERAISVCDSCYDICQTLQDSSDLAKVYNQLGLVYTQCKLYPKAATCFELALPLTRGFPLNRHTEAVVLQNLGAVYNSMGDYQRAVRLHEDAATLHGQVGNRSGQGQCFMNLAFAFSQLNDQPSAGDAYLHALQAAKDTDDKVCQWQALEGLAGVAYTKKDNDKAVTYYKQALSVLAVTPGSKSEVQERIVGKLTDALKDQVAQTSLQQPPTFAVKPPSRSTSLSVTSPKGLKREKEDPQFDFLHVGLGEYLAESDNSLTGLSESSRRKLSKKGKSSQKSDQPEAPKPLRKNSVVKRLSQEHQEPEYSYKKVSRHNKAQKRKIKSNREPLLRGTDYNSEEEWIERMKNVHGTDSDSSIEEYKPRTRPPSAPPPSMFDVVRQMEGEPRVRSQIPEESSDENSDSDREGVRQHMQEITARAAIESDGESDSESDDDGAERMETSTPNFKGISKKALDKNHNVGVNNIYQRTPTRSQKGEESESESEEEDGVIEEKQEVARTRGKGKQLLLGNSSKRRASRRLTPNSPGRGHGLKVSSSSEGSSSEEEEDKPPIPTTSPPATLNATYETPSVLNHSCRSKASRKNNTESENDDDVEMEDANVTKGTVYASLKPAENGHPEEDHYDRPPTLPPRNYSDMTRAERDIMMYEYNRQHNPPNSNGAIPVTTKSKTCTIL